MRWKMTDSEKVEVKVDDIGLKVEMTERIYARLQGYVDEAGGEISGMGEIVRDGDTFRVTEVYLLEQECSGADTHLEAMSIAKLREELDKQGKAQDGFKLWWHSHANMGVFWSGTDNATAEMLVSDSDWMVSIVMNKEGEILARLDITTPFKLTVNKLPVYVVTEGVVDSEDIKKEVADKVKGRGVGFGYTPPSMPSTYPSVFDSEPTLEGYPSEFLPTKYSNVNELGDGIKRVDASTPAARGEAYWQGLTKKEKKRVRKYLKVSDPFCLFNMCASCQAQGYTFWNNAEHEMICLACIEEILEMSKDGHSHLNDDVPPSGYRPERMRGDVDNGTSK